MKPKKSKTTRKPKTLKATSQKPAHRVRSDPQPAWAWEDLHRLIAARAYEIYEQRSRQGPFDDWLKAEREILKKGKVREATGGRIRVR